MQSAVAFLYLLVSYLQTFCFVHLQSSESCELVSIPQCKSMPYNKTRFPNVFKHARQAEAKQFIQQFDIILKEKCSKQLLFYLCAKIAPICLEGQEFPSDRPVPPCKSVCLKVKQDCMPAIRHLNKTWPKGPEHDCSALPEYENGVCITPGSFINADAEPELPPKQAKETRCEKKCKRRTQMDFRKYKQSKFDYAYRARLKQIANNSDGSTNFTIKVLRNIFNLKHKSAKANQETIISQASCHCMNLDIGKIYLFAGHKDTVNNQMVLGWVEYWKKPLRPLFAKIRKFNKKKRQQRKKP